MDVPLVGYVLLYVLICWWLVHFFAYRCTIRVKSCFCGAHWWIRRWYFFWRHLDASPFNDQLQNRWTIWMFEFRRVLKLTPEEQAEMGYPDGPTYPLGSGENTGKKMWARSKWQLSPHSEPYCLRCLLRRE